MKFFIYLSPFIFIVLLAVTVIECNNNSLFFTLILILIIKVNEKFHKLERGYRDCMHKKDKRQDKDIEYTA